MGSVKNSSSHPPPKNSQLLPTMASSQNVTARTIVPVIVNPESILVDSDSEVDLEQIQQQVAAEQR